MMFQRLPCTQIKALLQQGGQLVDVRHAEDYQKTAIPGSTNIPMTQLTDAVHQLQPDKPVLLFCRNGSRSEGAKLILKRLGFNKVYNLGGIQVLHECEQVATA